MEINLGELTDVEIVLKNQPFEKARVKWTFSSGAELRGGRITASKRNPGTVWAQMPKYQTTNGQWGLILKLDDEKQKYLEDEALKKYGGQESDSENEEIDLDSVPF